MSKPVLRARPIYHHLRQSIEAHLTIVTAALAMARWLETTTGWSIRRLITTARRYRTITINIAGHTLTAADPLPPDLTQALHNIHHDTKRANSGRSQWRTSPTRGSLPTDPARIVGPRRGGGPPPILCTPSTISPSGFVLGMVTIF